jgi:hypothetical protein
MAALSAALRHGDRTLPWETLSSVAVGLGDVLFHTVEDTQEPVHEQQRPHEEEGGGEGGELIPVLAVTPRCCHSHCER